MREEEENLDEKATPVTQYSPGLHLLDSVLTTSKND